jgi:hypothetical protein
MFELLLGRLVITHSTYVKGLIPWLKILVNDPQIQTITPGVIARVRGHCQDLTLRPSVPIRGGFKLMARRGRSAQEVFVITTLEKTDLIERLARSRSSIH